MRNGNIEFVEYVKSMQEELSRMAIKRNLLTLAYLLHMACLEAGAAQAKIKQGDSEFPPLILERNTESLSV